MDTFAIAVDEIYVPAKHAQALDPGKVERVADAYMESGHMTPIRVRHDGKRYVLVNGIHRLEACKALGEDTITAYVVQAAQH